MKITIELELSEKTTAAEIRQLFNIQQDHIAKDDAKCNQDILPNDATIINDDEITFCKPEMISIIVKFDNEDDDEYVKVLEGSTIANLIKQVRDSMPLPEKFDIYDINNKKVDIEYLLQASDNIKFTKIQ